MFYLSAFIWPLSLTGLFVLLLKKKFNDLISVSIIFGTLLCYLGGVINNIKIGYYFSWLLVISFFIIICYLSVNNKTVELDEFKNNFFTKGLFFYIILTVYCFILFKNRGFSNCDEFMHWGPMVRSMFEENKLYCVTNNIPVHPDYPPLFALLELIYCYFGNEYAEPFLYIGLISFYFSLFMIAVNRERKFIVKDIVYLIAIVLAGLVIKKVSFYNDFAYLYNSIYVDWTMMAYIAYILYKVYIESDYSYSFYIELGILLSGLLTIKQISIVFYLMILFYVCFKVVIIDKKIKLKEVLKYAIATILVPLLFFFTWKIMLKIYGIGGQFSSSLSIGKLISIITWKEPETWRSQVWSNFIYEIVHRKFAFNLGYVALSLIIYAAIVIFSKFEKRALLLSITYLLSAFGYAILLGAMYAMQFSTEEALELASFDRYVGSFLFAGFTLVVLIILNSKKEVYLAILLLSMVFLIEKNNYKLLLPVNEGSKLSDVLVIKQYEDYSQFNNNKYLGRDVNYIFVDPEKLKSDENYLAKLIDTSPFVYIQCYDDEFYKYWIENISDIVPYTDNLYYCIRDDEGLFSVYDHNGSFIYYIIKYNMGG